LDLSAMNVGDKVRVRGLVTPFGSAPADFTASSLFSPPVEVDTRGMVQVGWMPPSDHPFNAVDATGLTLDLSSLDLKRHHLMMRGEVVDLTTLTGPVLLAPSASGQGRYAIHGRGNHLFRDYSRFSETLNWLLSDAKTVQHVTAHGVWDPTSNTLSVDTLSVIMGREAGGPITIQPVPFNPATGTPPNGSNAGTPPSGPNTGTPQGGIPQSGMPPM